MFCFPEDNKIIYAIENTITEPNWKKHGFSTHFQLSRVVDRATTYGFPLHYICLPGSLSRQLRRGLLDTTLCDKVCQWLATGRYFFPGTPVSSTNKTERHDITEIMLKMALNTITLTLFPISKFSAKHPNCLITFLW